MQAPHVPTEESRALVRRLTGYGIKRADVARKLGITDDTLRKYYQYELDTGEADANSVVAGSLFTNATANNNVAAQIFWLKTRARWREKDRDEEGGTHIHIHGGLPIDSVAETVDTGSVQKHGDDGNNAEGGKPADSGAND